MFFDYFSNVTFPRCRHGVILISPELPPANLPKNYRRRAHTMPFDFAHNPTPAVYSRVAYPASHPACHPANVDFKVLIYAPPPHSRSDKTRPNNIINTMSRTVKNNTKKNTRTHTIYPEREGTVIFRKVMVTIFGPISLQV